MPDIITTDTGVPVEIRGYALIYAAWSDPLDGKGGYRELIWPAAAARLDPMGCVLNVAHDANAQIRCELDVSPDAVGVRFRARNIQRTDVGVGAISAMERGGLSGASFAPIWAREFCQMGDEHAWVAYAIRGLRDIALSDVGTYPDAGAWLSHTPIKGHPRERLRTLWDIADADWLPTSLPPADARGSDIPPFLINEADLGALDDAARIASIS